MYQCLFLRLTIRVKIRIKTKKQQFGWNQIVCFHLFRILSKKKKSWFRRRSCNLLYLVYFLFFHKTPSVLQVVNYVGPEVSSAKPRALGRTKEEWPPLGPTLATNSLPASGSGPPSLELPLSSFHPVSASYKQASPPLESPSYACFQLYSMSPLM